MRLDVRNPWQADQCKRAQVFLDGQRRTDCVVADSDQGFVEVNVGARVVGTVRRVDTKRIDGVVDIVIDGKQR